jgi:hypothetical protein
MSVPNRVLLLTLSQRTSAKGNAYLSGWLGKASVVGFPGEPDRFGNETWDLFVSTPEPRAGEANPTRASQTAPREGLAVGARHRGKGWSGSRYIRRDRTAQAGLVEQFDDSLEDIGR